MSGGKDRGANWLPALPSAGFCIRSHHAESDNQQRCPQTPRGGYPAKLDVVGRDLVRDFVHTDPDATLQELCTRLYTTTQVLVSRPTMSWLLQQLNLPRKKTFRPIQQERPDMQKPRAPFLCWGATRDRRQGLSGTRDRCPRHGLADVCAGG
jgi:hypothetical protein